MPEYSVKLFARGIVFADGVARFHRVHDDAVLHHVEADGVRGVGEGGGAFVFLAVLPSRDRDCPAPRPRSARRWVRLRACRRRRAVRNRSRSARPRRAPAASVSAITIATASPTNVTWSLARKVLAAPFGNEPSRLLTGVIVTIGFAPAASRSACVSTAITPGASLAALVSIERIFACPCGLRAKTAQRLVGEPQIIRVLTLTGDEADILRPADGLPCAEFHLRPSSWPGSDPALLREARPGHPTQCL